MRITSCILELPISLSRKRRKSRKHVAYTLVFVSRLQLFLLCHMIRIVETVFWVMEMPVTTDFPQGNAEYRY